MNFEMGRDAVGRELHSQDCNDRSDIGSEAGITPADPKLEEPRCSTNLDRLISQQPLELTRDYLCESRNEFIEELAYKLWTQKGASSRFAGRGLVRSGTSCVLVVSSAVVDYCVRG